MHIYGVGANGTLGSGVEFLMNKQYNKSKDKLGEQSFQKQTLDATVNAQITKARLTLDSNRVSKISRPFVTVDSEIRDVWGDVNDDIGHVSFLPENRPKLKYQYTLDNDEIKGLVDAGMYHNDRFEELFGTLLESEQFEITNDVDIQMVEVLDGDEVTPVILVQDLGSVKQEFEQDDEKNFTTFDYVIDRAIDMALQLEAEGVGASELVDEADHLQDIELVIDDAFDSGLNHEDEVDAELEEEVMRQLEGMDSDLGYSEYVTEDEAAQDDDDLDLDLTDAIDHDDVFGKTTEEQRIQQMRESSRRGEDISARQEAEEAEAFDSFDDLFAEDDYEEDPFDEFDDSLSDDFELEDTMEIEVEEDDDSPSVSELFDLEDEDEDDLEF